MTTKNTSGIAETVIPEALKIIEAFQDLSNTDRQTIAKRCKAKRYDIGQQILSYKDDSQDVFFILNGQVQAINYGTAGQQVTFQDLETGQMFGELSAIDGAPRSACIIAVTDALVISMTTQDFQQTLAQYPAVAQATLRRLTGMVRRLTDRVYERNVLTAIQRVRAELLRLGQDDMHAGNSASITQLPTHTELATHIGTSRETVSRELKKLTTLGLLERQGHDYLITDVSRLAQMMRSQE